MTTRAKLSIVEMRKTSRYPVDFRTRAEHRRLGEVDLHVVNLSPQGFMIEGEIDIERGERVELLLPHIGRIDAHLVWRHEGRCGFQLERIIRDDEFNALLAAVSTPAKRSR